MDVGHSSGPVVAGFLVAGSDFPWMWGIVGLTLGAAALGFATGVSRVPLPEA